MAGDYSRPYDDLDPFQTSGLTRTRVFRVSSEVPLHYPSRYPKTTSFSCCPHLNQITPETSNEARLLPDAAVREKVLGERKRFSLAQLLMFSVIGE
jgi:hypothetical protein